MLKDDFAKKVKEALNLRSIDVAKDVVDKLSALVVELVTSGEEISLGEIGRFCVNERAARTCRNPKTGETVNVPAKKFVKFKVSSKFKKSVNG
jgi:nucleoid DNA-binding protein